MQTPLLSSVLSLALTTPALLAQGRLPEIEPNDTSATAQTIVLGNQYDCNLVAAEEDWFQFTTAGGNVQLFLSGAGSAGTDTQMSLFDATATTLLAFNDDSRSLLSALNLNLAAGTYVVKINGFSAATTGLYYFDTAENPLNPYDGAEIEPNDTFATGTPVLLDTEVAGEISAPGDVDFFTLVLAAPRSGIWFQVTEGDAPAISRTRYEVYDATGVLLAPTATFGANAANSSDFNFRLSQIRCWPAGVYHIAIRASTSTGTGAVVPIGKYRFEVASMQMNTSGPVAEAAEPNNTPATATPIGYGQQGIGNLTAGDSDWWQFFVPVASVVMYQTGAGLPAGVTDTTLTLFDGNGVAAGISNTTGNTLETGSHARSTVSFFLAPGFYNAQVTGGTASVAGDYVFEIGKAELPYLPAQYAFGNTNTACLGSNALRPTITTVSTREVPVLGTLFSRTIGQCPANAPIFFVQGFSDTVANGGVTPLPFDLGPFGAPSCSVNVEPIGITLLLAGPGGDVQLDQVTTSDNALRGLPIYEQAFVLDPTANALGLTASNYARQILGDRSF